jgi:hypothetical protein
MDLFASLKEKGLEAAIQKSAPHLLVMLNHIHTDQSSIAESLGNIATRLAGIERTQEIHSRVLAQILTQLRTAAVPPVMIGAPGTIEVREALHAPQANGQA